MKKTILFLTIFLVSLTMQAKYYKATLTYEDGKKVSGFAEMVQIKDSDVKFKATEDGKIEKINSETLKQIQYTDEEGNVYLSKRLFVLNKNSRGEIKKTKTKLWFYEVYANGLLIVTDLFESTHNYNASSGRSTGMMGGKAIYLGSTKDDGVYYLTFFSDGPSAIIGLTKRTKNICENIFEEYCPAFLTTIENEDFDRKTFFNRLIELYDNSKCK